MSAELDSDDARRLETCLADGGVAIYPTDTVYGICCDPNNEDAARRLYALKGRPPRRACAVMFFALEPALQSLSELPELERRALELLLPGPLTVLLVNRAGLFTAACRSDPATLGLRVPRLPQTLAVLETVDRPAMQSSANLSGEPDVRALLDVPASLRDRADLVLDGGTLPGTPSTVVDLRDLAAQRRWHLLREGAMPREEVQALLAQLE
ncbi:MAG TPA: L-threonylcarbamoyladenylate synthase [Solirubrobacteraceae bacterium]|nr:L-threonylcarbamoyladenylate synthase [Solirubrobacteraceae bacterium]